MKAQPHASSEPRIQKVQILLTRSSDSWGNISQTGLEVTFFLTKVWPRSHISSFQLETVQAQVTLFSRVIIQAQVLQAMLTLD